MPDYDAPGRIIPITEEAVTVEKVIVQTDAVHVQTLVEETEVVVEDTVKREVLRVKRVVMDLPVDVAPPPREVGNITIVSIIEERLVVEKRLFVIEEIHITREQTQERVSVPVTLRAMRATVEQSSDTPSTGSTSND